MLKAVHRAVVSLLLGMLWMTPRIARAQGSFLFTITITGSERVGGQLSPVTGKGTLQLFGSAMDYFITVPVTVRPVEAHFHGPRVDTEMPQFSLVPFVPQSDGTIVYRGRYMFNPKYVPDIEAGKWYINLHSPDYENAVLSGYILPVPEPGVVGIFVVGAIFGIYYRGRAVAVKFGKG
jgi:hypothetical protein